MRIRKIASHTINLTKELCFYNLRLLTFRITREDFESFGNSHLFFGLFCNLILNICLWWNHPEAKLTQYLGINSVVHLLILSFIIWLAITPLKPHKWSYKHVLTFMFLTYLPTLFLHIFTEPYLDDNSSITPNTWFLATLAFWEFLLLLFYLSYHARLNWFYQAVVILLPVSCVCFLFYIQNLHDVVFANITGLRSREGELSRLLSLTGLSFFVFVMMTIYYLAIIIHAKIKKVNS
jgi:hypothetical protein